MSLNRYQYEALFTNSFNAPPEEFDITVDDSGETAVGTIGAHTVELLVIQGRAIEWRVDGQTLFPFGKVYSKDDPTRAQNADLLRSRLP